MDNCGRHFSGESSRELWKISIIKCILTVFILNQTKEKKLVNIYFSDLFSVKVKLNF